VKPDGPSVRRSVQDRAPSASPAQPTGNLLGRFVAINVLGIAGTAVIGFGLSIALARWLGPSDRGLLALMYSVSWIALMLGGVGIPWAAIYFSTKRDVKAEELFGNSLLQAGVLAALLIPATVLLQRPISNAFGQGRGGETWVLAAVLVPVTFLNWTTHGQLQGMLLFGRYNVLSVISKAAEAVSVLILLGALGLGVTAGMIAYIVASAVMVVGALKPILAAGRPRLRRQLLAAMLRYGSRVQMGSIFQTVIARLDIVILQLFRPLTQVGYYAIAQIVAEVVLQLTGAFQSSVLPLVAHYEQHAERQASTSADSVRHHCILAGAATLAIAVLGPLMILFLYGSTYRSAIAPMLVLLPAVWFAGMGGVIQSDLSGRGMPGTASKLAGLAAAVTVALDFALIPPFGVMGAAVASLIVYSAYGIASLIAIHRVSGIPIRRFVAPTRADLNAYRLAAGRALARLRPSAPERA
jgi:stage V sporulation protein B